MRSVIATIALVFAFGVVMPADVDARAPRELEKWGCTFRTRPVSSGRYLDMGIYWEWGGEIHCDQTLRLTVTTSVFQDVPGRPDRLWGQQEWTMRWGRDGGQDIPVGGKCSSTAAPSPDPYYLRMTVRRKGQPGVARVASRNVLNPCPAGRWPLPQPK
jgi:hypothetical protein